MPTSQRAGIKRPAFVVARTKDKKHAPFMYPDVDILINNVYFYDEGHTAEIEVGYPIKDIVHLPKLTIRRRLWCLPHKNYEKHVVINNIAFPESLWEDFGIHVKKITA